jgi:translocation and assembly module TamB
VKRKLLAAAVGFLIATVALVVLVLRTPWAGERACAIAQARVRAATGVEVAVASCRFEPTRLRVTVRGVRVGPAAAPVFTAEAVRLRLSVLQLGGRRLDLAEVEVVRPRVVATLPAPDPGAAAAACPPPLLQRFGIRRLAVTDGSLDLTLPDRTRLMVGKVDVRSASGTRGPMTRIADVVARRASIGVSAAAIRVERAGRRHVVDGAHLDADVALDLSRAEVRLATVDLPGVTIHAAGAVRQLCRPSLDLAASIEGDVRSLLALAGRAPDTAQGRVAIDATLAGSASAPAIEAQVRLSGVELEGWRPGDATARLRWAGQELRIEAVDVPTLGGRIGARGVVRLGGEVRLEAEATLQDVELGEIFGRMQVPGAWVMARVGGTARVRGTASPLQLEGEVALDAGSFRVLDHSWERYRPGESTFVDVPRFRLEASARIDRVGVRVDRARLRAGDGNAALTALLHFDGDRGFELTYDGTLDLGLVRHLGPVPVAGLARLDGVVIRAAPYGNPRAEGRLQATGLRLLRLDLGEASARLSYRDYVLEAVELQGRRGATRYDGAVRVALGRSPVQVDGHLRAGGRLRDLFEAAMPWQPAAVHARDALDGDVAARGTLHGAVSALQATFDAELGRGELLGRPFESGRVAGRVVDGARAVIDVAELRSAGGAARAAGWVGLDAPFPWSFDGSFAALRAADLALPGATWGGTLSGDVTLRGSYAQPRLDATASASGLEIARVPLGDVRARAHLDGAVLDAAADAEGVRVTSRTRLAGDLPFEGRAEIDAEDALRWWPGGSPAGLRAQARGAATFGGAWRDLAGLRLALQLERLRGGYGDFRVEAAAPVVVALDAGRVTVRSFTLRGPSTELAMGGTRDAAGALSIDARGSLDLRLLGGVLPGVADPRGQLLVEGHVGGTAAEPLLVGAGRLRDAGFKVRDVPVVFTGIAGDLAFSQNRVLFDRLAASVNGGRAALDGELELVRFVPARVRVGAQLEQVPVRIPAVLPSVLSGRLQATGTWDAMRVGGKLHVVRALYAEPLDLEKRLVQFPRRRAEAAPFDRAGDWVSLDVALAVDGDARIENDVARGRLQGDLTLTGTLASPGMVGTLTMAPGSRGTFRGNEFALGHAVVDFTDRHRIRMSLDVHGEAQVQDYQVFMHLFGPYDDPTIHLTTQPMLSQQDIVTLLSLGYTTRDTAAAAGVSGVATAAAAQALFTASGLDEQVRRFVPKGKVLRDFSVRFTTAYSEGAGQVVPRAEFESKVLDDRFRLRYQAPLAGARGQRAQAEMRLGEHTSLQYQWDTDTPEVSSGGDHGVDLKLRWDWTD